MKKTIALLSCLLILASCAALAGCGKQDLTNSKYLGTWVATKATLLDEETPIDEAIPGGMTMKLNPDGTAVVSSKDGDSNCTWKETSKGIKFSGDMKVKANAEGDELVMKIIGLNLHFVKMTQTQEAVSSLGDTLSGIVNDAVSNADEAVGGAVNSLNDAISGIVSGAADGE